MKILAVANRDTVRTELSRELSALFPEAEIIEEADALMAGKYTSCEFAKLLTEKFLPTGGEADTL